MYVFIIIFKKYHILKFQIYKVQILQPPQEWHTGNVSNLPPWPGWETGYLHAQGGRAETETDSSPALKCRQSSTATETTASEKALSFTICLRPLKKKGCNP